MLIDQGNTHQEFRIVVLKCFLNKFKNEFSIDSQRYHSTIEPPGSTEKNNRADALLS